jgi:hypothetical protein
MSVGEFTVSNIHMDEDKRDEETKNKNSQLDTEKFKKDVAATLQLADQVGTCCHAWAHFVALVVVTHLTNMHNALLLIQGQLAQCVEGLLNLEKTARVAEDVTASKAACRAILEVCFTAKDWKLLEEHIVLLSKRRGQLKQVIDSMRTPPPPTPLGAVQAWLAQRTSVTGMHQHFPTTNEDHQGRGLITVAISSSSVGWQAECVLPVACAAAALQVIQAFVRQAMSYMDATPDKETLVSLIKTLQTVTEGKVRTSCNSGAGSSAVLCTSGVHLSLQP